MEAGKNPLIIFSFGTDANLPRQCLKVSFTKQRLRNLIGGVEGMMKWTLCSSFLLSVHEYIILSVVWSNNTDFRSTSLIHKLEDLAYCLILTLVFFSFGYIPVCWLLWIRVSKVESVTSHGEKQTPRILKCISVVMCWYKQQRHAGHTECCQKTSLPVNIKISSAGNPAHLLKVNSP